MKTLSQHALKLLTVFILVLCILSFPVFGADEEISLVNSQDWVDVYSVMLHAALQGQRGFFVDVDTTGTLTKVIAPETIVHYYASPDNPRIANLQSQLKDLDYENIIEHDVETNINYELDPQTGNYYLVSLGNPRILASIASLAVKENAWVFVVDVENADEIAQRIDGAQNVIAVGNFPRDVQEELEEHITEEINNDDVFKDSQVLAQRFGGGDNIILTDGSFIEAEFFYPDNPVMLTGKNKILAQTVEYLQKEDVEAVVLVGNHLAVVGEQIRAQTNGEISVFVKFGQGDTTGSGQVYAISTFPLPALEVNLGVSQAIYDQVNKVLIITYRNLGNTGLYALSTIDVMSGEDELGSTADEEVLFIGAGELLPVSYPLDLPTEQLLGGETVELYTSFGIRDTALDNFMTEPGKFGPPYVKALQIQTVEDDDSLLFVRDATYYKNLNRIVVDISNEGPSDAYFTLKINDLIVNGLQENFQTTGQIPARTREKHYLTASLDSLDLEENENFHIILSYGENQNLLLKTIIVDVPFKVSSGGRITGFVTGLREGEVGSYALLLLIVGFLAGTAIYFSRKIKSEEGQSKK